MVPNLYKLNKKKNTNTGGSENFYNIGSTENTISPRGSKTYSYE